MRRIVGSLRTKQARNVLAAAAIAGLVALVVWRIDRARHGPRTVEPHDEAVAARILAGLGAWDAATTDERRAAAVWVGSTTPGFAFDRLETFGFEGHRHEVAVFTHAATGLEFSLILGGTFLMGSGHDIPGGPDELQHAVTLTMPFLLCRTEATQAAWERVMASNPSLTKGEHHPVENVSWDESAEFCRRAGLRLPSEAQWEYACRAGTTTRFWSGDDEGDLARVGWYSGNTQSSDVQRALRGIAGDPSAMDHRAVAQKPANPFGLHDVHGNVWEWCEDWYGGYPGGAATDPTGPTGGEGRVHRGGAWASVFWDACSAWRDYGSPDSRRRDIGLRPARSIGQ